MTEKLYKNRYLDIYYTINSDNTFTITDICAKNDCYIEKNNKTITINLKEFAEEYQKKMTNKYKNNHFIFNDVYSECEYYKKIFRSSIKETSMYYFDEDFEYRDEFDLDELFEAMMSNAERLEEILDDIDFEYDEDEEETREEQIIDYLQDYDFCYQELIDYSEEFNTEFEQYSVKGYEYHDGNNWKKVVISDEHDVYCEEVEDETYLELAIDEEIGKCNQIHNGKEIIGIKHSIETSFYVASYEDYISIINEDAYTLNKAEERKLKLQNYFSEAV